MSCFKISKDEFKLAKFPFHQHTRGMCWRALYLKSFLKLPLFVAYFLFSLTIFCFVVCRVIFVFHKNGHLNYKAKVKPPRLDGEKVGVYSTRSPHRPNALGLTLAKLDKVRGK